MVTTRRARAVGDTSASSVKSAAAPHVTLAGTKSSLEGSQEDDGESEDSSSEDESSGSEDSSSEDEDSSSASSSSSSAEEEDDVDEPDLAALLAASIEASRRTEMGKDKAHFEANEDVIHLADETKGEEQEEDANAEERSSIQRETKIAKRQSVPDQITKKEEDPAMEAYFARLERGDELGENKPKTGRAALRQRQAERAKTAGPGWFDLPAFPGSTSSSGSSKGGQNMTQKEQLASLTKPNDSLDARSPTAEAMRREVQAIRLRNAMDPKRFYRGGSGDKGMPKYAQLGRVISSATQPASTLARQERGRTVVEELVKDAQASAYAKRKFQEQNVKRTPGQRPNFVKRKPGEKSSKRQRR